MQTLPNATHRYLLEPLSGEKPVLIVLIQRFLSFLENIEKSNKSAIKMLKMEVCKDVRSTTRQQSPEYVAS